MKVYCGDCKHYCYDRFLSKSVCVVSGWWVDTYIGRQMKHPNPEDKNYWNDCKDFEATLSHRFWSWLFRV